MLDPGIEKIAGRRDALFKFVFAPVTNHRIGILAGGHFRDPNDEVVLQERVKRTLRRLLARGVGVETKNDFAHKPFQNPRLILREGCSLRRDHIGDAGFEDRDEIELSFADDRAIRFDQAAFRFMQTKEDPPFPEKRRFGRVQILGALRLLFEHPTAEGDYFADIVVNREHDAAAKSIVGFSIRPIFISRLDQSALQNLRAPITAIDRPG